MVGADFGRSRHERVLTVVCDRVIPHHVGARRRIAHIAVLEAVLLGDAVEEVDRFAGMVDVELEKARVGEAHVGVRKCLEHGLAIVVGDEVGAERADGPSVGECRRVLLEHDGLGTQIHGGQCSGNASVTGAYNDNLGVNRFVDLGFINGIGCNFKGILTFLVRSDLGRVLCKCRGSRSECSSGSHPCGTGHKSTTRQFHDVPFPACIGARPLCRCLFNCYSIIAVCVWFGVFPPG